MAMAVMGWGCTGPCAFAEVTPLNSVFMAANGIEVGRGDLNHKSAFWRTDCWCKVVINKTKFAAGWIA